MKSLLVGDLHATPEELDDCANLMALVESTANDHKVDEVCFMGDQHHTHAIIRAEVMAFYRKYFKTWKGWKQWHTKALVGNHDFAGEGHPVHAMMIYEDLVQVVDKPMFEAGRLYVPYYSDREAFLRDVNTFGGKTLISHQTYAGSRYENGFYASDGVNPDLVPQTEIVSGHIHSPQNFGKVTYIGAPRWRSLSDANLDRAIWLYDFAADGTVVSKTPFLTNDVCKKIHYILDTPDDPFDGSINSDDWRIDVKGPAGFVDDRKKRWAAMGAKVRTFYTDQAVVRVRESEGIGTAFQTYLKNHNPKHGTPVGKLAEMARDRLHV